MQKDLFSYISFETHVKTQNLNKNTSAKQFWCFDMAILSPKMIAHDCTNAKCEKSVKFKSENDCT